MDENPRPRLARPKYQVFVSSTFVDLHKEREAVTWEILKAGHIPVGMENFSARDERGWKVISRTLETTDYYVLIVAGRYGSVDAEINMSWTEREYRRAVELGIPVLAFIRERQFVPGDQVDTDEKFHRLADLISDINKNHIREMWRNQDDLPGKVSVALLKAINEADADGSARLGWYRGNQLPSPAITEEMARLSSENRELRLENDRFKALMATTSKETTFAVEVLDTEGKTQPEVIFAFVQRQDPRVAIGAYTQDELEHARDLDAIEARTFDLLTFQPVNRSPRGSTSRCRS